ARRAARAGPTGAAGPPETSGLSATYPALLGVPAGRRERCEQVADLAGDAVEGRLVVLGRGDDGLVHPGRERGHVLLTQAAGGDRGRADAQAGGVERLALVERHRVVVRLDARPVQRLGGRLAA